MQQSAWQHASYAFNDDRDACCGHVQAHARMGEEGNAPASDEEAEQAAGRNGADGRDRGQYITVSLKPGVAQVGS